MSGPAIGSVGTVLVADGVFGDTGSLVLSPRGYASRRWPGVHRSRAFIYLDRETEAMGDRVTGQGFTNRTGGDECLASGAPRAGCRWQVFKVMRNEDRRQFRM